MKLQWKKEEHECSTMHSLIKDFKEVDVPNRLDSQGKPPMTHQPRVLSHTPSLT